jgi:hypothetical protein
MWVKLDNEHWYEHGPKSVETSCEGKVITSILWNQPIQTNIYVPNDKPEIILHGNETGHMVYYL